MDAASSRQPSREMRGCREAIDDMIDVLGEGIANICYVLAPDTFVLGGGIMAQQEYCGIVCMPQYANI